MLGPIAPAPLSVAIVAPTLSRAGGGIFSVVLAHARELTRRPATRVTVYGLDDDPQRLDRAHWRDLTVVRYPASRLGFAPRLAGDLERDGHDIVHQHGLWLHLSVMVSRWRRRTGRPVVLSPHGMLEPWALGNSSWKKRLAGLLFERQNLCGAAAIHCSPSEASAVRAHGVQAPIATIPNGTDLPDLSHARPVPGELVAPDRRTLLFLARLHPKKGIAELLEAFALLKAAAPKLAAGWRLLVVGWDDGGHAAGFEACARALGLTAAEVAFPGPRFGEDKSAMLAASDAFVLPSHSEGFPMAVLEAWAHALPVLMTAECNIPEGFAAGAAVRIVNEPRALAAALERALADPELPAMGQRGRQLVEGSYAWPAIACELGSVYAWLTGREECPPCVVQGCMSARRA
ncbi:glycosyltransferase [Acuticoccus sp.]|uniref:glycosyltransferase n=1 Tax=Acuticoccus sp. TaxID=1904378 RepID=UPI003B51E789